MILQPAVNAFAMAASMHGNSGQVLLSHSQSDLDSTNNHYNNFDTSHQQMSNCISIVSDNSAASKNSDPAQSADDCCAASACCAVSIVAILPGTNRPAIHNLMVRADYTVADIILPIEIKPPRSNLL